MSRAEAILESEHYFDGGAFFADLARRVAIPTESQNPARRAELLRYLDDEMRPGLERLGFRCTLLANPAGAGGPFLAAERIEDAALPTVLSYGHGDVIRGQEAEWRTGLNPWVLTREGDRLYGRGSADNKGQHSINLGALEAVLKTRGRLGFNLKLLLETGEETGSAGLRQVRAEQGTLRRRRAHRPDGPRLQPARAREIFSACAGAELDKRGPARRALPGNWGGCS
jgi:acetylornithine deacetylase/succinyl-diaminopimelate desuccinylase-like protein